MKDETPPVPGSAEKLLLPRDAASSGPNERRKKTHKVRTEALTAPPCSPVFGSHGATPDLGIPVWGLDAPPHLSHKLTALEEIPNVIGPTL